MRSPVEIWIKEHRIAIDHADRLAEMLAPPDIQSRLMDPAETRLRRTLAGHLDAVIEMANNHFRHEEKLLVPAIVEHLGASDSSDPSVSEALGCLAREHSQMHRLTRRLTDLLPSLKSDEATNAETAMEILTLAFGVQSVVRHHCTKEEREIFPLVGKLPPSAVAKIMEGIGPRPDIPMDHLIKPLGGDEPGNPVLGEDGEGPDN